MTANVVHMKETATIAVVGLGYVGRHVAKQGVKRGNFRVFGIDSNPNVLRACKTGDLPDESIETRQYLQSDRISYYSSIEEAPAADVTILAVPTPTKQDKSPDLSLVTNAARSIGTKLERGNIVSVESTVAPSDTRREVISVLERASHMKCDRDFHVLVCPEKINPGDSINHIGVNPRTLGASSKEGLRLGLNFYERFLDRGTRITTVNSLESAEFSKMLENTARDVAIAFVNEQAMAADKATLNFLEAFFAATLKGFGFPFVGFRPGIVAGHCISVDPYYLDNAFKQAGFNADLMRTARKTNESMKPYVVHLLERMLGINEMHLQYSKVAILGTTYKANIADTRNSGVPEITQLLEEKGATVETYDPLVDCNNHTLDETLAGTDAAIMLVSHDDFMKRLHPSYMEEVMASKILLDVSSSFSKFTGSEENRAQKFIDSGFSYAGFGTQVLCKPQFRNKTVVPVSTDLSVLQKT